MLEKSGVFSEAATGVCRNRSTADSIADLASALDRNPYDAPSDLSGVPINIHRFFDALPHVSILRHICHSGVGGRMLKYFRAFFFVREVSRSRTQYAKYAPSGVLQRPSRQRVEFFDFH